MRYYVSSALPPGIVSTQGLAKSTSWTHGRIWQLVDCRHSCGPDPAASAFQQPLRGCASAC